MRRVILATLLVGCAPTFETVSSVDEDTDRFELELDPFNPVRPACWPTAPQQARFDDNLPQRGVFPWTAIAGTYHGRGDAPGAELVIFEEGRYEWRSSGCTGTAFETGIVDHWESWVSLETPECRNGREPRSAGLFRVGEHHGLQVLADPDTVHTDEEEDQANPVDDDENVEGMLERQPIFFPSIEGKLTAWYERE
ncbi:MAG: hypothetical protein IT377_05225 [Polyangiaceae bacterium]|nr:hypothetical protein [Polyangiaceae bacterium]